MATATLILPFLAAAGLSWATAAQAQTMSVPCDTVLEIGNWSSTKSEGHYFSSRVEVRNIATGPIQVTITYAGRGAVRLPPVIMGAQAVARRELAQTNTGIPVDQLQAATTFACLSGVTERLRD